MKSGLIAWLLVLIAGTAVAQMPPTTSIRSASDAIIDAIGRDDSISIEQRFDASMRAVSPHEKFKATLQTIRSQAGTLVRCFEPVASGDTGHPTLIYPCDFTGLSLTVGLRWNERGELGGLSFSGAQPLPAPPLPTGVREIVTTTGAMGWSLPAVLLIPTADSPPPVALLVPGSGPGDRDGINGPNAVFRDLAYGLATKGVATMRFDKRTRAQTQRFFEQLRGSWTFDDEIVDDAVAALRQLAQNKDCGSIFIVGHSEGGLLAPRIAARARREGLRIAGVAMLAAPLTPLSDLLVAQYTFLAGLPGSNLTQKSVDAAKANRDRVARLLAGEQDRPDDPAIAPSTLSIDMLHWPASAWRDIGRYDPAATLLDQSEVPVLMTFGGRDFAVPIAEKALWEARIGARPRTVILAYPTLNHLLIEGSGPMSTIEYSRRGHVSEVLIGRIVQWIGDESGDDVAARVYSAGSAIH